MKRVFISHDPADKHLFHALEDAFKSEGFKVFSADHLPVGESWQTEVFSAIRRAHIFVAAIARLSSNVMLELGYALGAGKKVVIVRAKKMPIPFDIASLPVFSFDEFDSRSVSEMINQAGQVSDEESEYGSNYQRSADYLRSALQSPALLEEIPNKDFERHVGNVFEELGFHVQAIHPRDQRGYDLLLLDSATPFAIVEIKKYNINSRTSVNDVQRVLGAAVAASAPCAIIVTTGGYTSSSVFFAQTSPIPIILLTLDELLVESKIGLLSRSRGAN